VWTNRVKSSFGVELDLKRGSNAFYNTTDLCPVREDSANISETTATKLRHSMLLRYI
jgi:hypothetical protein